MIQHTQNKVSIFDKNGNSVQSGNCWQTTIASIINYPISEVPNFEVWFDCEFKEDKERYLYSYYIMSQKWLESKGWELDYGVRYKIAFHPELITNNDTVNYYQELDFYEGTEKEYIEYLKIQLCNIPYICSGKSPRGNFNHVVIYQNGELLHDVHPSRDGIENIEEIYSLEYKN